MSVHRASHATSIPRRRHRIWPWVVLILALLVVLLGVSGFFGLKLYSEAKQVKAQEEAENTEAPKPVKEKTVTEKPKPNRSAQQARRQLTICEKEISAQETAIAEIEQRLEEAGGDYERYSEIYKEKEAAEQMLSELMEKWETLAEQAGE